MITSDDLFFLIDLAEVPTSKRGRERLANLRTEAEVLKTAEHAEKCWLRRCNRPVGVRLTSGGYSLHLCYEHRGELEEKAGEANGYSSAAPAKGYRSHWPWKAPSF